MEVKRLWLALLALCLVVTPAAAQQTGSVSGVVFDQTGARVADATVRITGAPMPAGRTTRTDQVGMYQFQLLLPGEYSVQATKAGVGDTTRSLVVDVSKDTQVDLVLGVTVTEELTVSAATPVVDLQSTEVNFNYKAETIETLPLERSYSGLFQLIPGVAENNSFAPNGGGSRQDNTYLIDGVNITNPLFGYLSTEVNEFDIVEFNVKRGGITAEFGRSSGFVTNAVTRSGTNEIHGGLRFEMIPADWVADSDKTIRSTLDRYVPAFAVGGPVIRDRLFFYASGRLFRSTRSERQNNLGPIPDEKTRTNELFGKLTAQPNDSMFFNVGYRHRPTESDFAGVGANDSAAVATNNTGTNRVFNASWNWFPTDRTVVDVKYLHMDEENEAVAVTDLGFRPAFDVTNLAAMGRFVQGGQALGGASLRLNLQNYKRDEIKATVSQFLDFGGVNHQLKVGGGWENSHEDLTRQSNGWGSLSIVQRGTQVSAVYYPEQPSQLGIGKTYSLFVQDDMTISDRLVVNAGLLFNRDEFSQETDENRTFLTFGFGDEIQPRIGVNYQLREQAGDKVYANWGRYYNLDQKSTARSLAPRRLFTSEALFDATTGALISDEPSANTVSKNISPDIEAPYMDEFLVGYATPLLGQWGLDVFFIYRDSDRFIEDEPQVLPSSNFIYRNVDAAERRYRALTFELSRRMADNWSVNASYGISKLYGNFDLDYSSGAIFNTSSALQDGPGLFVQEPERQGVLSQDRTHVFKLFASYMPPALKGLTLGAYLRSQSGTPWEARGRDWYNGYRRYLEQAGTNRNGVWTNVDLLTAYRVALPRDAGLKLELRVLNLLGQETALSRDQRQFLDGRIRSFSSEPFLVQGTTQPNPNFGEPDSFAPPRRGLLTLVFDF